MKGHLITAVALLCAFACADVRGQTFASGNEGTREQLKLLTKQIEEQNLKIDTLSQQILKLEQRIAAMRPGVMIGETTPAPARAQPPATAAAPAASPAAGNGNTHIVARGETLISIAKAHKVDVDALQKHNNIEDARKLQAGQTLIIPGPRPAGTPNE